MTGTHELGLRLGPTAVELSTDRVELQLALAHVYRPFVVGPPPAGAPDLMDAWDEDGWRTTLDGEHRHHAELSAAVFSLTNSIGRRLIDVHRDQLLLHAAVVADESGTTLLAGPSGTGKTTLALELVRRGRCYLTDEFAAVRGDAIQPLPRSASRKFEGPVGEGINMRVPSTRGYRAFFLPDHRAGLEQRPLGATRILFPRHVERGRPSLRRLGLGETCALLTSSTFDLRGREKDLWPAVADLAARARACALEYPDTETGARLALEFLEDE